MRQAQQSRSARTSSQRPPNRRARDRVREPDAPTPRRRAPVDAPTKLDTVARPAEDDDVDVDAILGECLPEPDAPVKTNRQAAAAMPVSTESAMPSKSWREMFEDGLRMQVRAVLSDHELTDVEVEIDGARVALHGSVPDILTSQLIEDLAWSVPAVRQCENHLRVLQ